MKKTELKIFSSIVGVILLFGLVLMSCLDPPTPTPIITPPPLENSVWILESYGSPGSLKAVLPDTEVTARFNSSDKKVTGSGGCNSYGGSYLLSGNKLSVPAPLISTKIFCGEGKNQQEQLFFSTLQSAESYHIADGKLTIDCGDNILVFIRQ
jgi:heat shock protein HslJ